MLEYITKPLFLIQFIPHGHCYLWKPGLVSLHIASDLLIALAYYSIPLMLVYFVKQRRDIPFNWIFLLFGAFIVACGTGHLIEVWTLWHPDYWVSGFVKATTAGVSVYTAMELVPLIPQALALPSAAQLEVANHKLQREINERQQAESKIRFQARLLNAVQQAVIATDIDGTITYWNRFAQTLYGWSEAEVIGSKIAEIIAPPCVRSQALEIRSSLRTGESWSGEFLMQRRDGSTFPAMVTDSPIYNDKGELIGIIGISTDITYRVQAEEALRESEQRYRTLAENNTVGVWHLSEDGYTIYINPTMCSLLEIEEAGELAGKTFHDFFTPESLEKMANKHSKSLQGQPSSYEVDIIGKNGCQRTTAFSCAPLFSATGQLQSFIGAFTDITEQKWAEAQLRRNVFYDSLTNLPNRALLISRLKDLIDTAKGRPDYRFAVLFLDLDRFKLVNDCLGHFLGDQLLKAVAQRLQECLRPIDTVSRFGGDEFAILQDNIQDVSEAVHLAEQIHSALASPFYLDGHEVFTSASIGIAINRAGVKKLTMQAGLRTSGVVAQRYEAQTQLENSGAILKNSSSSSSLNPQPSLWEGEASTLLSTPLLRTEYNQPEDFLRDADIAMYRAKGEGKACHVVFDSTMHERAIAHLQLETDLRRAVEELALDQQLSDRPDAYPTNCQFQIYYQPIVLLSTGRLAGFEALARWIHPTQGMISPVEFIPIAEETGLIVPLGWWILREACHQMRTWQQANGNSCNSLTISVNLSGKQFLQPDLVEKIDQILKDTGLQASCLKLEITESVLIENAEAATVSLEQLRSRQIELSLDDFGTGYSSLSYLHRFPINTLKIDRSFVSRLRTSGNSRQARLPLQIVQTIVTLAHNLGMDVVAEGIETPLELEQLRLLGCEHGQGYLFSKPLNAAAAEKFIYFR